LVEYLGSIDEVMGRIDSRYSTLSALFGLDFLFGSMIINSFDVNFPVHPYAQRNFLALATFAVSFIAGYFQKDSSLGVKALYYSGE
jgi:hypothetical protein